MGYEKKNKETCDTRIFQERLEDLVCNKTEKEGLTQNEIAKRAGIAPSALTGYLSDSKEPKISSLYKIAKYFNVSTDYLLGLNENPSVDLKPREITKKYGLSNEALETLEQLAFFNMGENEAVLEFLNVLIKSGPPMQDFSWIVVAYIINSHLNKMKPVFTKDNNDAFQKFAFYDYEKYDVMRSFDQLMVHLLNSPVFKKRIEKVLNNGEFMLHEYDNQISKCKRGEIIQKLAYGNWPVSPVTFTLKQFFGGYMDTIDNSDSSTQPLLDIQREEATLPAQPNREPPSCQTEIPGITKTSNEVQE